MKAYSYIRFSSDLQSGNDSVNRQMKATRAMAEQYGYILEDLSYKDLSVSAKDGANWMDAQTVKSLKEQGKEEKISALANFHLAVITGEIESPCALIIDTADRFSRGGGLHAISSLNTLVQAGVTLINARTGLSIQPLDNDAPEVEWRQRDMAIQLFLQESNEAQAYIRDLARKVKSAKLSMREGNQGSSIKRASGAIPWWFDKRDILSEPVKGGTSTRPRFRQQIVVNEEKAELVRKVFKLALSISFADISIKMKEMGYKMSISNVQDTLKHKAVYGRLEPRQRKGRKLTQPVNDHYPAILTKRQYDKTRKAIEARRTRGAGRKPNNIELSYFQGLLKFFNGSSITKVSQPRKLVSGGVNWHHYLQCVMDKKLLFRSKKKELDELVLDLACSIEPEDLKGLDQQKEESLWLKKQTLLANERFNIDKKINTLEKMMLELEDITGVVHLIDAGLREKTVIQDRMNKHAKTKPKEEVISPNLLIDKLLNTKDLTKQSVIIKKLFTKIHVGYIHDIKYTKLIPLELKKNLEVNHHRKTLLVIGELSNGVMCMRIKGSTSFIKLKK